MNILLFKDLLKKLRDILNDLDELLINSEFETLLNDLRFDVKKIASNKVVLPALFSPHRIVMSLSKDILDRSIDLKF